MLEAKGLTLRYGRRTAVDGVDLRVEPGECVVLAGPNGSGKSTLLRGLARLMRPAAGAVTLDGRPLPAWPAGALARRMAVLPQSPHTGAALTVEQLVALGRHPHQSLVGINSARDREVVHEALDWTELSELANRPLASLSGGERQRAWIALTLAQEPDLLLLDEPTTYLDLAHAFSILDLIRRLNRERNMTVVMALHDLAQAARFADRIVLLQAGHIRYSGAPGTTLTPATIAEVFGVEAEVLTTSSGIPAIVPVRTLGAGERRMSARIAPTRLDSPANPPSGDGASPITR